MVFFCAKIFKKTENIKGFKENTEFCTMVDKRA